MHSYTQEQDYPFLHLAWQVFRASFDDPRRLASLQSRRLSEIVRFARIHSPFYAEKYRQLPNPIRDVRLLPLLTKREVVENFDQVITDPKVQSSDVEAFVADPERIGQYYLGRYMTWVTSGTTGMRAVILADPGWDRVMNAINLVRVKLLQSGRGELHNRIKGGSRWAYITGLDTHFIGAVSIKRLQSTRAWNDGRICLISVADPLSAWVEQLNRFQPTILTSYASALALLAEEQQAGRLFIRPSLAVNAAEALLPADREKIQAAFGCRVQDMYSATEAGNLAFECRRGQLHVNADWVILEAVDENFQPVPLGQTSNNVLVTNLANRVMPIIRYELRDQVTFHRESCPCRIRLPVITIEGRVEETLVIPDLIGRPVRLLPLALSSVIKQNPGVSSFQVIQTGERRLRIRLALRQGAESEMIWQSVFSKLHDYLLAQGLEAVELQRASEPPQRDPVSRKHREVWREYR